MKETPESLRKKALDLEAEKMRKIDGLKVLGFTLCMVKDRNYFYIKATKRNGGGKRCQLSLGKIFTLVEAEEKIKLKCVGTKYNDFLC